jgi:hypothetical protein
VLEQFREKYATVSVWNREKRGRALSQQRSAETLWEKFGMADRIIVYWRDIPAQVIIKKGRATAKRELSLRFTEAIDMCAMRTGAAETDDYLAEWRKADPVPVSDDLEAEADRAATEFEEAYDRERLVALVKAGGRDNG